MGTFGVFSDSCLLQPTLHVTVFAMVRSGDSDHLILTAKMARVKEKDQEREVERIGRAVIVVCAQKAYVARDAKIGRRDRAAY
jgi:hypothetical protein